MNVTISPRAQQLIKEYMVARGSRNRKLPPVASSVDFAAFLFWLNSESTRPLSKSKQRRQEMEFILVSLRAELLHDLYSSMTGDDIQIREEDEITSWADKLKFACLTFAGILVAACQGFDGIATMLSIFALPSAVILGAGFVFSLFSIVVFCGFDLVKVSNALGVKLSDAYKLLDAYSLQLKEIKAIRKKIADYSLTEMSEEDLKQLELIISMLKKRFISLADAGKQFDEAVNSEGMQIIKTLVSGLAALLFFGGGFFAGQSVALFLVSLIISSATPAFWPVIIFSSLVGLAALSIYWYVERPGLQKLISGWFGLNEESVEKLCDKKLLAKEERKLDHLKEQVMKAGKVANKLSRLEQRLSVTEDKIIEQLTPVTDVKTSANFYSFLKPPAKRSAPPSEDLQSQEVIGCCI